MSVRTAIIGVGVMGKKYAEMITAGQVKDMTLTAVVARKPEVRDWAENLINGDKSKPNVYASSEELFDNSELYDAVLIVTPHKTHPELAKRAFELGKHVLCDKPAGVTIKQAQEMSEGAKAADRIYGMIFHQRMYPKYKKIKEILDSGALGKLSRIMLVNSRYFRTAAYHRSGSWRSSWNGEGGGALINQGAHILDIWQWLFGMPDEIYADIVFGKYNDFMVDDEATIQMRYKDNLTAVFMLTTGEAVWEERLEIIGSRGKMLLENDTLHIWHYSMDSNEYIKTCQSVSRENMEITEEIIQFQKAVEPYPQMLENFAGAVINGDASMLAVPGESAVNQIMLTNAAYYSAWNKCAVKLPLDAKIYDKAFAKKCEEEAGERLVQPMPFQILP